MSGLQIIGSHLIVLFIGLVCGLEIGCRLGRWFTLKKLKEDYNLTEKRKL